MSNPFENAPVIFSYSRAQAIEDGVLVELDPATVREAGFKFPIAMTSAAFSQVVWPIDDEKSAAWLTKHGQDFQGRLWDVLSVLRFAVRRGGAQLTMIVKVLNHRTKCRQNVTLKSVCGPGDNLEPVITIMLPDED